MRSCLHMHGRDFSRERKKLAHSCLSETIFFCIFVSWAICCNMSFSRKEFFVSLSCNLNMGSCISCNSCAKEAKVSCFVILFVKLGYAEKLKTIILITSRTYLQIIHCQCESRFTHGFSSGCGWQKPWGMNR